MTTKVQIKPSIDVELEGYLKEEAKRLKKPYSLLVNDALAQYLDVDSGKNREAILLKRLDQLDRKLELIKLSLNILSEAFSIFLKTYFARLEPIASAQKELAIAKANQLFQDFLTELTKSAAAGGGLINKLPQEEFLPYEELIKMGINDAPCHNS